MSSRTCFFSKPPPNTLTLLAQVVSLLEDFELPPEWREQISSQHEATIHTLESISDRIRSPAQHMKNVLHS